MCFWHVAETLPPAEEDKLNAATAANATRCNPTPYQYPEPFPASLSLHDRLKQEPEGWTPERHEGTGVNEDESYYTSELLPVDEACRKLRENGRQSNEAFVIEYGWNLICERWAIE